MAIKQLTVFVQNKKGSVVSVTDLLSQSGVDLRALSIAETQDLGILRLIVNDEKTAERVLTEHGYLIKVIDVVGVKIADAPGIQPECGGQSGGSAANDQSMQAFHRQNRSMTRPPSTLMT